MRRHLKTLLFVLAGGWLLAACSAGEPQGVSVQGRDTRTLYVIILVIALVVFVLVDGTILYFVLRYRRRPGDDSLPPQIHGNTFIEIVWTVLPALIITALFVLSVRTLNRVNANVANPAVTIEVTGFQWQWNFKYPSEGFTVRGSIGNPPEMVLPVNEDIRIDERSLDVIHSFYVPQFLYKKDVIPGQANYFFVHPDQEGVLSGQCAEFCGLLHNKMTFSVRVVSRPEYNRWVLDQKRAEAERLAKCGDPTDRVEISASQIKFDKDCFALKANADVTIAFDNKDPGTGHNVQIYRDEAFREKLTDNPVFPGPAKREYKDKAPAEGEYFFKCDVHPGMAGTVLVK